MMHYETQQINLLLVESNEALQKRLNSFLQDTKLNIVQSLANSGSEAVALYKNAKFDCILMNNQLVDMNAHLVLSMMQDGPTLTTPLIVYTEQPVKYLYLEIMESGAIELVEFSDCNGALLRRLFLYAMVRQQYVRSQTDYLESKRALELERQKAEEQRKIEQLRNDKLAAEKANEAKSLFLSNMSHELRTPLNAILGFAQLLAMKNQGMEMNPKVEYENIQEIISAGNHLLSMINNVLDLSKLDVGQIKMSLGPVSLDGVLSECIKMVEEKAIQNQCTIDWPHETALVVKGYHTRLKQVIVNLLTNAIKYNRIGGSITIATEIMEGGMLRLSFTDTGIGIAEHLLDEVFKPFNRLSTENNAIEGSGIGLTLSQRLMNEMNGDIGVTSRLGEGSCFWIDIPLMGVKHDGVNSSVQSTPQLVYIDADIDAANQVETMLKAVMPVEMTIFDSLVMATLNGGNITPPDMIIVDYDLLDCSMMEVLSRIRRCDVFNGVPIVLCLTAPAKQAVETGLKLGFSKIVAKPLTGGECQQLLEELCFNKPMHYTQ